MTKTDDSIHNQNLTKPLSNEGAATEDPIDVNGSTHNVPGTDIPGKSFFIVTKK